MAKILTHTRMIIIRDVANKQNLYFSELPR